MVKQARTYFKCKAIICKNVGGNTPYNVKVSKHIGQIEVKFDEDDLIHIFLGEEPSQSHLCN
jgi:hypothetical protein